MAEKRIFGIHPSFRIVALAEPPEEGKKSWITEEMQTMFQFHAIKPLSRAEESLVIQSQGYTSEMGSEV